MQQPAAPPAGLQNLLAFGGDNAPGKIFAPRPNPENPGQAQPLQQEPAERPQPKQPAQDEPRRPKAPPMDAVPDMPQPRPLDEKMKRWGEMAAAKMAAQQGQLPAPPGPPPGVIPPAPAAPAGPPMPGQNQAQPQAGPPMPSASNLGALSLGDTRALQAWLEDQANKNAPQASPIEQGLARGEHFYYRGGRPILTDEGERAMMQYAREEEARKVRLASLMEMTKAYPQLYGHQGHLAGEHLRVGAERDRIIDAINANPDLTPETKAAQIKAIIAGREVYHQNVGAGVPMPAVGGMAPGGQPPPVPGMTPQQKLDAANKELANAARETDYQNILSRVFGAENVDPKNGTVKGGQFDLPKLLEAINDNSLLTPEQLGLFVRTRLGTAPGVGGEYGLGEKLQEEILSQAFNRKWAENPWGERVRLKGKTDLGDGFEIESSMAPGSIWHDSNQPTGWVVRTPSGERWFPNDIFHPYGDLLPAVKTATRQLNEQHLSAAKRILAAMARAQQAQAAHAEPGAVPMPPR